MKKQMIVEFPEKMLPQICKVEEQLRKLPGVEITLEPEVISYPGLQIETAGREVYAEGIPVSLSTAEFEVLFYLAKRPGRVVTYEQIYQAAYGAEEPEEIRNSVYCLIRSLRKKLKKKDKFSYIHTIRGIGYKFQILSEV